MIVRRCKHLRGIVDVTVEPPRFRCDVFDSCVLSDCKSCKSFIDTGVTLIQPTTIPPSKAESLTVDESCPHRGEIVRQEKCGLCGNRDKIVNVRSCSLHGECVLSPVKSKIKCCKQCEDGPWADF